MTALWRLPIPVYRALRPQNKRTRSGIDAFRDEQIRRLVEHAHRNVPYYRQLFESNGIDPREIRTASDLERIPVTTRLEIQEIPISDRVAKGVDPASLLERRTTGSTGQCLTVMRTWTEEQILNLFRWRAIRAYGLTIRDVIGVPRVKVPRHRRDHQLPRRIADALHVYRKSLVDLRTIDDAAVTLHRIAPDVVMGWPTILAGIAPRWAALQTVNGSRHAAPRFVITGGEVLTPFARREIEEGFDAPVRDMIAAHEFSLVGWQCPRTGEYHLSDETVYAEVLHDGRPANEGETGELVGTALHSFAMPFIRYKLGDIVIRGSPECACGSPFSTVKSIRGRAADYLSLPEGRLVHPQDIARDSYIAAPWIKQLQVVHEEPARIALHVVPLRKPSQDEIAAIQTAIAPLIGKDVVFEVVLVPAIETAHDAKFSVYRTVS